MANPMIDNFFKHDIQKQITKIITSYRKNFPNEVMNYMIIEPSKDELLLKLARFSNNLTDRDIKNNIVIAYLKDIHSHNSYYRLRQKYGRVSFTCRPHQFCILFFSIPNEYLILLKLAPREMRQSFLYNMLEMVRPLVIEDRFNLAQYSSKTNELDTFALNILRKIRNQIRNDVNEYEYFEEERFN